MNVGSRALSRRRALLRGLSLAALLARSAAFAEPAPEKYASPSVKAAHSTTRLLSAGAPSGGVYHAGLEIALDPLTITYWRSPGEAGSPPQFDFSASQNVASIETLYPTPRRIKEADSVVAGYDETVVFPLRVTPRDTSAPVTLALKLNYAECGKICLPAKATLSLSLPPAGASPFASALANAEAATPKKLDDAEARKIFALEKEKSDAGKGKVWTLRYTGKGRASDVFVEAPDPAFVDSAKGATANAFTLTLAPPCCGETAPGALKTTVTVVTDNGAIEASLTLD
jgi:DsbC/DsbD-like thiol-disulfide interchange protein